MRSWVEILDFSKISDEDRVRLLEHALVRFGKARVQEVLGVDRSMLWRIMNKKVRLVDDRLRRLLTLYTEDEFREVVGIKEVLRLAGVYRDDGTLNYSVALQIISLASRDEYLKQALLRFTVENFKEDLKKMLGIVMSGTTLTWTEDFEEFLRTRKKRRRVTSNDTITYYKSLFKKFLEGKELTEELIEEVVNHENKWVRNIFRHYVQYLYHKRKISPEVFGWVMEVVPARTYRIDVRPYQISLDEVKKTLNYLKKNKPEYYLLYTLMLESGIRMNHAIGVLNNWSPDEIVYVHGIDAELERLVCFEKLGFCRYYFGVREGVKPCEWVYFTVDTLEMIREHVPLKLNRHSVRKYVVRHELLFPKMMRKVSWRIMVKTMPREVARFIQSRFGEIRVSEARYEDLLTEADRHYPKYASAIKTLLESEPLKYYQRSSVSGESRRGGSE